MTLLVSWFSFILIHTAIYHSAQSCDTTDRFNQKWFGADCQYKCHCKNNVACDVTNGDCPNGCISDGLDQLVNIVVDLAKTAQLELTDGAPTDRTKITDGDDTTCASLTGSNFSLHITWNSDIYFTWLRLVVGNGELQKESISIKFLDYLTTQDMECKKVFVDKLIMDIYCNISKPLQGIVLNGSTVSTLCSLYISKGRNVALKQPTNQTTTFPDSPFYISSSAVDGNTEWGNHSCTHTNESGDPSPTWTLYFKSIVTVASYTIYNRVDLGDPTGSLLKRLKGFILRTVDQTNNIVQIYIDTETSALTDYNFLSADLWAQVSKVQITATYQLPTIVLTLCEVEIFGVGDPTGSLLKRLKGFILRTVDQTNNIVQIYIDTETSALTDYNFLSADLWAQVSKVQITATYQLPTIVLTLCEVEIFGVGDPTGSLLKRLKGFILRTVDQTNNIVQIYIDTETSALTDYNFLSADLWAQVSKVQITATYQLPTIVLTLCEVEIFGVGDPTGSLLKRLKGFILRTVDQTNNIVQIYIDTETSALTDYNFLSADLWAQVSKVQITATYQLPTIVLTLCEVEIFGVGDPTGSLLKRLKGFILRTVDQTNNIVQIYIDTETSALTDYNFLSADLWAQVSKVQITATYQLPTIVLTLCEVEIFGDSVCPRDKFTYGRDCENVCNCAVEGERCLVSTGNCPSGCKAGFFGQGCKKTCDSGYFGIDCRKKCSNCSGLQCDGIDGKCTSCATTGKKLPYCIEDCDPGFYGSDCKSNCSQNCSQTGYICDAMDGKCFACKPGFYGSYCTTPCSSNCKDSICDIKYGICISCRAGFQGDKCDEECSKSTYGESCKAKCSSNCNTNCNEARNCDNDNGHCLNGCQNGFEGLYCSISTSKSNIGLASGVGIGIGVTIAADIVIGIVIYIWYKRRQKPPPKPLDTAVRSYDHVDPIQQNEHQYYTVDKSGDGYDLIQDVVAFNKKNNSVVTAVHRESHKNTGGSSVSS